jgi:hypothetical protein
MNRAALETAVVNAMTAACEKEMQWGVDDCTLWCANIIRNTLGYDPAKNARGRYKTRNGARRFLGTAGLKGALTKAARRHKWKRIDPEYARPGDVGLAWTTVEVRGKQVTTLATMICRAPGWFVGRNERGFTAINSNMIVAAWSVLDDAQPGPRVADRVFAGRESRIVKEPVSIGIAVLSAAGILEVSATAAFIVGSLVLTAPSIGLFVHLEHP